MAASGKAADSGLVQDGFGSVNTSLGVKVAFDKAQTLTSGQKTQALANIGAQATLPAGTSGQVLTYNGTTWAPATPASGGATIDTATFTGTITN